MRRTPLFLLILIVLPLVVPANGHGIPVFARKYGFNCMMCHTAYPKLNDWGQRFRDNGYQLPGQEGKEKNVFDTPTPLALRTSTGFNGYDVDAGTTSGFDLMGLDLLAAGVMHRNVSVLLIYTPRLDEPAADCGGSNPSQPGALESASVVFSNVIPSALNVRVGRFEPSYHLFSSKRSFYLLEPYEAYGFTTPTSNFVFDDNQIGVEVTGHWRMGFKYGAGIVNGTGPNPDNNRFKDVYLSLSQTVGPGDGQSAGQRIGVFGYYGKQPLTCAAGPQSPTGEMAGCNSKPFYRLGGTASATWRTFNLMALYLTGVDDKALNTLDGTRDEDYEFSGGLAELDYSALWNNRLVTSLLYNWVAPPSYDEDRKVQAFSALVRYYLGDWTAVNVAFHGEYTHRTTGEEDSIAEDIYSVLVDFAF